MLRARSARACSRSSPPSNSRNYTATVNQPWRHQLFWPIVLIVVGIYLLLHNLNLIRDEIFWPLVLIAIGVWLILRRART